MGGAGAAALAFEVLPAGSWLPAVRRRVAPALLGRVPRDALALTFDDGPAPESTPLFLAELDRLDVRATFFCVGEMARRHPALVREIDERGHRIGVHGWLHRNQLLRPGGVHGQLRRARDLIGELSGQDPGWYRPPYGVLSGEGLLAARALGLRPVLWSRWGKDWRADATADTVYARVCGGLVGGATILLHDADTYAQPGSWRAALGALDPIVGRCRELGLQVGGLPNPAPYAGFSGSGGS